MAKKQIFIDVELDFAEEQLSSWKAYVDANPMHTLKDRISFKETKNGGMIPMVVASIEQQGKFLQETMKNYLALLKEVNVMREAEEAKKEARGSGSVPHRMQ
jgi:hypothetical protein